MVVCASADRKKVIVSDKQLRNKRALRWDWTLSKLGLIGLILFFLLPFIFYLSIGLGYKKLDPFAISWLSASSQRKQFFQ